MQSDDATLGEPLRGLKPVDERANAHHRLVRTGDRELKVLRPRARTARPGGSRASATPPSTEDSVNDDDPVSWASFFTATRLWPFAWDTAGVNDEALEFFAVSGQISAGLERSQG